MIDPVETARAFQRHQVGGPFDYTNEIALARGVGTNLTGGTIRESETSGTKADSLFHFEQRLGQRYDVFAGSIEQIEGQARRGFLADSGKAREFPYQSHHCWRQA